MIPLFLGLAAANVLLMGIVFFLGLMAIGPDAIPSRFYAFHISMAIASGLMMLLAHVGTYMYFMATSRWLEAATNKAGLSAARFHDPARKRKSKVFAAMMAAVTLTMLTMFAGAAADPTVNPLWPGEVHMVLAIAAITVNLLAHAVQFQHIRSQSRLMDEAVAILNAPSNSISMGSPS